MVVVVVAIIIIIITIDVVVLAIDEGNARHLQWGLNFLILQHGNMTWLWFHYSVRKLSLL